MTEDLQRTEAWHEDRAGRITASRFVDVLARNRTGGYGEARGRYMRELAFERLASKAKHSVSSKSLTWGTEVEQPCHDFYELTTGLMIAKSAFVQHPTFSFIGCSPDGLVGMDGGIESKAPFNEAVHIQTWLCGMPEEHIPQVQGCMFVTGRKWWDFLSFDPRQAEPYRLYVQRIPRDEEYIANLKRELLQFEVELQEMVKTIEARAAEQAARFNAPVLEGV